MSIFAPTLVALNIVCATAELPEDVLNAHAIVLYTTVRSFLIDSTFAVRMVLYSVFEFACKGLL